MKDNGYENNQLRIGVILAYVSIALNLISVILYTPFMLRKMGQAEYGLYSLCYSFVTYLTVLDFGIGNATIRYVAKYREIGNEEEKEQINGMFLSINILIGLIAAIVGVGLYFSIGGFFAHSLTPLEIEKAKKIILILLVNVILSFPLSVFSSILTAHENFIFIRGLGILRTILMPCLMIPLLLLGYKSISMSIIVSVLNILSLVISMLYCVTRIRVKFRFFRININLLQEVISYSFFAFLLVVVDKVNWSIPQIILGKLKSTSEVAIYSVASQIAIMYMSFPTAFSGVMLPKITMQATRGNSERTISDMFLRISRIQFFVATYILFGFVLVGKDFLTIWAGDGYEQSFYIGVILMSSLAIPLSLNIGNVILQAKNMQKFRAVVLILVAIVNVAISIPLTQRFGGIGCAFGIATSYLIGPLIIMSIYFSKRVSLDMKRFWRDTIGILIISACALVLSYSICRYFSNITLINILVKTGIYSIIFFTFMVVFCFNEFEKSIIRNLLGKYFLMIKKKEV